MGEIIKTSITLSIFAIIFFVLYSFFKIDLKPRILESYRILSIQYEMSKLRTLPPDQVLFMPIKTVDINQVSDTWGAARSRNRTHEGQDIFSKKGTPVYSSTNGYVLRTGINGLGGNYVMVLGAGGRRYYYAHLDSIATGTISGVPVSTTTILGFVGNTGNAKGTPDHLHFGVYTSQGPINPYPLLINSN